MTDPRVEALARELSCHPPQGESWKMDAPEARRLLAIIDKVDPARVLAESVVTMMRRDGIDVTQIQTVMRAVGQYLASSASAVPSEPPPPPDYGDGSECCASGSCEVCSPWRFR